MIEMDEFKQLCAINANAMASWKRFAKAIMARPYRMALAEIRAEPDLHSQRRRDQ